MGKVKLVGAGPGDPELISIKGMNAIQAADVILYDALVCPQLIQQTTSSCKRIYVGKRRSKKEFSQEEINQLLVYYALRFANVVRLKGGDPNVFGRGQEEADYVAQRGIEVEIIPGISSVLAAPNAAGIPLTKRGVNESFWVITGTLSCGGLSHDLVLAAQSTATIVILMGFSHLKKIAEIFSEYRSADEPVAIIQQATLPEQKIIAGTCFTIFQKSVAENIGSPAVIVIGKVVLESKHLKTLIAHRVMPNVHS
jgi:uroporphyrin-III C-methyltransferase